MLLHFMLLSQHQNGVHSTKIVEKLGTLAELSKEHDDPIAWAKQYIEELNLKKKSKRKGRPRKI